MRFCVIHSQGKKKRQHGTEAVKSHILAAKTVANIVKSSLVRVQNQVRKKLMAD